MRCFRPEKKSDSSSETKKSKSDEIEASGAEASGEAEVGEKEESINEVTKSGLFLVYYLFGCIPHS